MTIRGLLVILPGLTTELISKHLSTSSTTVLCNQDGKNRRCALMREVTSNQVNYDIASVSQSHSNIICSMVLTTESLHSYSDQTGNFPIKLTKEICICLCYLIMKLTPSMHSTFPIAKLPQFGMHGKTLSPYNTLTSKGYPSKHPYVQRLSHQKVYSRQ